MKFTFQYWWVNFLDDTVSIWVHVWMNMIPIEFQFIINAEIVDEHVIETNPLRFVLMRNLLERERKINQPLRDQSYPMTKYAGHRRSLINLLNLPRKKFVHPRKNMSIEILDKIYQWTFPGIPMIDYVIDDLTMAHIESLVVSHRILADERELLDVDILVDMKTRRCEEKKNFIGIFL